MLRVSAALAAAVLAAVAGLGALVVLVFVLFPLSAPDAFEACADPCFGPPASYDEVLEAALWSLLPVTLWGLVVTAAVALVAVARGRRPPGPRRLALIPAGAGAALFTAVAVAQVVQAPAAQPAVACEHADLSRWPAAGAQERQRLAQAVGRCDLLDGWSARRARAALGPGGASDGGRTLRYAVVAGDGFGELVVELRSGRVLDAYFSDT
ncbi:MAG TPA: hypothetical protein VM266_14725 [Solirubrobacteraceae bacterium]|nr:hypothetical protein [Solirubrobacteraceae bacterium]